jgi:four helix bundle protein
MQDFRKLVVWQRAHALALGVDRLVRGSPRHGGAALRKQLGRAADSIAANIAEGCGAASPREFARYLDIAIKSSSETEYHLTLAGDRGLMPAERCHSAIDEAVQIRRMLFGLRKRVLGEPVPSAPAVPQSSTTS